MLLKIKKILKICIKYNRINDQSGKKNPREIWVPRNKSRHLDKNSLLSPVMNDENNKGKLS